MGGMFCQQDLSSFYVNTPKHSLRANDRQHYIGKLHISKIMSDREQKEVDRTKDDLQLNKSFCFQCFRYRFIIPTHNSHKKNYLLPTYTIILLCLWVEDLQVMQV